MLDRRRARSTWAVAAALAALLGPCLPAHADPSDPTPSELQQAHQQVADAQASVQSLHVRAEAAAEAYNGAMSRARRAEEVRGKAASRAAVAASAEARAQGIATGARAAADTARAKADRALAERSAAEAEVAAAQTTLNRMAVGAYKTGGAMGVVGSLLQTSDPSELARGQAYVNRVGAYQRGVVLDLAEARKRARAAAAAATAASTAAGTAASRAEKALATAAEAAAVATSARTAAAEAAADAQHQLFLASKAKAYALYLVSRAEAQLGTAKQRAARLERAAEEARREAAGVRTGRAPSDAARTAMDAAMRWVGTPYAWGGGDENGPTYGFAQGAGTKGFDCSGLTLYAYAQAGVRLDHYSVSQYDQGRRVGSRSELEPGDLMFFAYDTSDPRTIHHVSMYLGNGKMIEAPYTGEVVRVVAARTRDYIGATRPWS